MESTLIDSHTTLVAVVTPRLTLKRSFVYLKLCKAKNIPLKHLDFPSDKLPNVDKSFLLCTPTVKYLSWPDASRKVTINNTMVSRTLSLFSNNLFKLRILLFGQSDSANRILVLLAFHSQFSAQHVQDSVR